VCFVALTYIIEPPTLGEQKSKAAQLGIKRLMEAGVQPHLIACRADNPVSSKVKQKIAMFSNVPMRRVFSMHDRSRSTRSPRPCASRGSTARSSPSSGCTIASTRPARTSPHPVAQFTQG
jgi:CTP synthase (UTP-ammonia lyase)